MSSQEFPFKDPNPYIRRLALRDFLSSGREDMEGVLKRLLTRESDPQVHYEIRKALGELSSLSKAKKKSQVIPRDRLENALSSSDLETLKNAFVLILKHRLKEYLPQMKDICSKRSEVVLKIGYLRLLSLEGGVALDELKSHLKDSDPRVVCEAVEGLGRIGNTASLAILAEMSTATEPRVQSSALKVLGELGDETVFYLFEKMIQSPYAAYRDAAASAIQSMELESAIPLLENLLSDETESVRIKALRGLESLAKKGYEEASRVLQAGTALRPRLTARIEENDPSSDDLEDSEIEALHSDRVDVRLKAFESLSNEKGTRSYIKMIERLKIENETRVIAHAIMCLERSDAPDELKIRFSMAYLSNSSDRVRANAIEVLSKVLPEDRLDFFLAYLNDENNRVIGNAIMGLARSSSFEKLYLDFVQATIKRLLNHEKEEFQWTGLFCIGCLQNKEFLPLLVDYLKKAPVKGKSRGLEILQTWAEESGVARKALNTLETGDETEKPVPKRSVSKKPAPGKKLSQKKSEESLGKITPITIILYAILPSYRWVGILIGSEVNLYVRLGGMLAVCLASIYLFLSIQMLLGTRIKEQALLLIFTLDLGFVLSFSILLISMISAYSSLLYLAPSLLSLGVILFLARKEGYIFQGQG